MCAGNRATVMRHTKRVGVRREANLCAFRLARLSASVAFVAPSVRAMQAQQFFSVRVLENDFRKKQIVGIHADRMLASIEIVASELCARRAPVRQRLEVEQNDVWGLRSKCWIGNEVLLVEDARCRLCRGWQSAACGQQPQQRGAEKSRLGVRVPERRTCQRDSRCRSDAMSSCELPPARLNDSASTPTPARALVGASVRRRTSHCGIRG